MPWNTWIECSKDVLLRTAPVSIGTWAATLCFLYVSIELAESGARASDMFCEQCWR